MNAVTDSSRISPAVSPTNLAPSENPPMAGALSWGPSAKSLMGAESFTKAGDRIARCRLRSRQSVRAYLDRENPRASRKVTSAKCGASPANTFWSTAFTSRPRQSNTVGAHLSRLKEGDEVIVQYAGDWADQWRRVERNGLEKAG